jgi:hypothetical protein
MIETHKQDRKLILNQADIARIHQSASPEFTSEAMLRQWISDNKVDVTWADSKKGINKLFQKIVKGEARMVADEDTGAVFRLARVAKVGVDVTIGGQLYALVELCQVFLNRPIDPAALTMQDPAAVAGLISQLDIRSAQVRDSLELWETLVQDEDASLGARRGLVEELGLTETEASEASLEMTGVGKEYEAPIDWPGIHSILETNGAKAVLPERISKPTFVEIQGGDQITLFVATPGAPLIRALLGKIVPNIHYIPPPR